ncbi:MAG: hypothetical protein ACHQ7H_06190 [Candidatus Rokuibacteriota bacterium]|jgi:hypothetical protein
MDGLRQIHVITQGDGWHLVGLDAEGRVWFGSPRRTAKGRMLAWILMDESVETEDPLQSVPAPELLAPGVADRHWPTKQPRP